MIAGIGQTRAEVAAMRFGAADDENRIALRGGCEGSRFGDSCRAGDEKDLTHASILYPNPLTRAHGLVARIQYAIYYVAVLVSFARRCSVANTLDEVAHFRLVAVGEGLFGQRTRPAEIDIGLFHYVARGLGCECGHRRASGHVGEDRAIHARDLIAPIHTTFC